LAGGEALQNRGQHLKPALARGSGGKRRKRVEAAEEPFTSPVPGEVASEAMRVRACFEAAE
jgi:hypothetical protein